MEAHTEIKNRMGDPWRWLQYEIRSNNFILTWNQGLIHGSLGPLECKTRMASRSVQPFSHGSLMRQTDW